MMTRSRVALGELRALLDALCEERTTPEQMRRLEELLSASPEAVVYYVQYMHLVADVEKYFQERKKIVSA